MSWRVLGECGELAGARLYPRAASRSWVVRGEVWVVWSWLAFRPEDHRKRLFAMRAGYRSVWRCFFPRHGAGYKVAIVAGLAVNRAFPLEPPLTCCLTWLGPSDSPQRAIPDLSPAIGPLQPSQSSGEELRQTAPLGPSGPCKVIRQGQPTGGHDAKEHLPD